MTSEWGAMKWACKGGRHAVPRSVQQPAALPPAAGVYALQPSLLVVFPFPPLPRQPQLPAAALLLETARPCPATRLRLPACPTQLCLHPPAGTVLDLFCALNPALRRRQLDTFCWPKLWLGFYLNNAGKPLCTN